MVSRIQATFAACMFAALVFCLIMANRTGQQDFADARRLAAEIETLGLQMNVAMYPLMFELQMDFDSLSEAERKLRVSVENLERSDGSESAATLISVMQQNIEIVEDFKSQHAVFRNSRAIIGAMISELSSEPRFLRADHADSLHAVDSAFLNFIGRRDPMSEQEFRDAVYLVSTEKPDIAATDQWLTLDRHVSSLLQYAQQMTQLMFDIALLPTPQAIDGHRNYLQSQLLRAATVASRYRIGLFVIALALLAFGILMARQARRYVQMLNATNGELESRVAERTRELNEANIALVSEIGERERVEAQLLIAQKIESIGHLASGIAHEINTPTQYVNDNVQFVQSAWRKMSPVIEASSRVDPDLSNSVRLPFLVEQVPKALDSAIAGLRRVSDIVAAMNEFSHPGAEILTPSDLNKSIENAIVVSTNEWKYCAEVETHLDPNLPLVSCNASSFNQAILNLIVNAAHAIGEIRGDGERGHIRISTACHGNHAEVVIEDDGPGVDKDIRTKIFDPFFTTKDVGKGTGQGLTIAHKIITQQHGGTLVLEEPIGGRGARFVIRLPVSAADSVAAVQQGRRPDSSRAEEDRSAAEVAPESGLLWQKAAG